MTVDIGSDQEYRCNRSQKIATVPVQYDQSAVMDNVLYGFMATVLLIITTTRMQIILLVLTEVRSTINLSSTQHQWIADGIAIVMQPDLF